MHARDSCCFVDSLNVIVVIFIVIKFSYSSLYCSGLLLLEEGDRCIKELHQTRFKDLLVLINFLTQVFNRVEEGMQVQRGTVMLPLHVLKADVQVRLEKLVSSCELGHTR